MLKTSAYGLGFQHLPRDLANVKAWKTMFDPYIVISFIYDLLRRIMTINENHSVIFVVANKRRHC